MRVQYDPHRRIFSLRSLSNDCHSTATTHSHAMPCHPQVRRPATLTISSWCVFVDKGEFVELGSAGRSAPPNRMLHANKYNALVRHISNPQLNIAREIRVTMGTCGPQMAQSLARSKPSGCHWTRQPTAPDALRRPCCMPQSLGALTHCTPPSDHNCRLMISHNIFLMRFVVVCS